MTAIAPLELLTPAVEAGRRALRALDDEEVPAGLRRVAASSARRLPPPFAERLLDALDSDEWLRGLAAGEAGAPEVGDGSPARAVSGLFLHRPEGWEAEVSALVADHARAGQAVRLEGVVAEAERLRSRIGELEGRLAAARDEAGRARREAREDAAAERDRLAGSVEAVRRDLDEARREAAREGERSARLEADLAEADARIGILRDRLARSRADRPRADAGASSFGRGTPLETARVLDQLAEAVRRGTESRPASEEAPPLSLPSGVRPDRAEAVGWLLGHAGPLLLVVDGYNVAHELAPVPDRPVRDRVHRACERIRRLADGPVRVVVFWDSGEEPAASTDGQVAVRFVPHADDAIVDEVSAAGGEVVVVTSDRELRERVEAAGAVVLWSAALVGWMTR